MLGMARERFISLLTPTVTKRVVMGMIRNVAFDQRYAVLLAATGDWRWADRGPRSREPDARMISDAT